MSSQYIIVYLGTFSDGEKGYRVFERENVEGHESYVPCSSTPSDVVSREEAERWLRELTVPPKQKIRAIGTTVTVHGDCYVLYLACGHEKLRLTIDDIKVGSQVPCVLCVREKREQGIT